MEATNPTNGADLVTSVETKPPLAPPTPTPTPPPPPPPASTAVADPPLAANKGFRFWAIMVAICFTGLLGAMEATITSTALPSVIASLGGGDLYIWAVNGFLLSSTAFQPLFGQLANVFGRRWPVIVAVATFILGSGISGGATSIVMLIAGRVVQGIGGGGINVLIEIIVCDIVPLRERGTYLGVIFGFIGLGTSLGPLFGGLIVEHTTWRWVFYISLPVGGLALFLLTAFLKVNYEKETTLATKVSMIDWTGNVIFVAALTSVLIALSWAGAVYPWSSFHVLVPLIVGLAGLVGFLFYEGSRFCPQPMMPLKLFSNRTSSSSFAVTFLQSLTTIWLLYFLPVYFQGVQGVDPQESGVRLLPTILLVIPFGIAGGVLMTKTGRYRPFQQVGFALFTVAMGLLSILDEDSNAGEWVGFQVLAGGIGLLIPGLLPAVLAPLAESDTALATATFSFLRSFGMVWGVAIAAAVFNTRFDQLAYRITDPAVRADTMAGQAYQRSTSAFLATLEPGTRAEFMSVVRDSLSLSFQVSVAFSALGFFLVFIQKEIPLRDKLDTKYGIADKDTKSDSEAGLTSNEKAPGTGTTSGPDGESS
ncbi:major facilitator superfamily protein [Lasiosphaeria ovina]|uniref:Major facilitator superfamily protein n=1 Tax=Lasiosphaeria ovina TaxID=92902 RepID=A0AAE0NB12_9PEZI|nr:major facilitator superfamily protein [Lasiosphaeria ovina]